MLSILNPLRELNTLTVCFRMILAFACGTVIGLERSYRKKRSPAVTGLNTEH